MDKQRQVYAQKIGECFLEDYNEKVGNKMIYIYTQKQELDDYILMNDWYFNLYTANQPLTEEDKNVIKQIDNAKVLENMRIETEYGIGTIRNLSSGCKTYLNIVKNPSKVVCADECGKNVLDILFQLDDIKIYMNKPERFEIAEMVKICFNEKDIVTGRKGYEEWWSKEYERRRKL